MAQFKTRTLNINRVWNSKLRLKVNDCVIHNDILYQNVTGINTEPGINEIDWIRLAYKLFVPFIPLSGTEVGSPVTGNIEIQGAGADLKIFSKGDSDIIENQINFGDGSIEFGVKNNSSYSNTSIKIDDESIVINNVLGSRGLIGSEDFTPNITDLDYTQKIYVDGLRGKHISKTKKEILALTSPEAGETYFNTTDSVLSYYDGSAWYSISSSSM